VVATIATVGYGDISGHTTAEQSFCILLQLLGVSSFSFASGALTSLLNNMDTISANLKEKLEILQMIKI
jgi:hypothetical protein